MESGSNLLSVVLALVVGVVIGFMGGHYYATTATKDKNTIKVPDFELQWNSDKK